MRVKPGQGNRWAAAGRLARAGRALRVAPLAAAGAGAVLVVYAFCAGAWLVVRWRAGAANWPLNSDTGLSFYALALGTAAPCAAAWALTTLLRPCRLRVSAQRAAALAAPLLVLLALVAGAWQCWALVRTGVRFWQPDAALFSAADLEYLHAVKVRLKQLQAELEKQRGALVGEALAQTEDRLALVDTLQAQLVGWTEREVGRWLEDTDQRRSLLALAAFQIHPGSQSRAQIQERVEQERAELIRRCGWLRILREHCARRLAQQPPHTAPAASPAPPADRSGLSDREGAGGGAAVVEQAGVSRLQRELEEAGARGWSFACAVAHDLDDATMTAEYLNQIDQSLAQVAARGEFVTTWLEPMWGVPPAAGLNQRYAWLQLPAQFPQARNWAIGFRRLMFLQLTLLLVLLPLALLAMRPVRGRRGRRVQEARVARTWVWASAAAAVALGNAVLLLL